MVLSESRPYPQLTAEQKDKIGREVVLYLALIARYRLAQHRPATRTGEQLELFSVGGLGYRTGD